jgi:hypothetical protein
MKCKTKHVHSFICTQMQQFYTRGNLVESYGIDCGFRIVVVVGQPLNNTHWINS